MTASPAHARGRDNVREPAREVIVAVASGWAPSRRGLVRMSGAGVPRLIADVLHPPPDQPRAIRRSRLVMNAGLELPCLAIRYDAPRSFTGEHGCELLVPGNPLLLERVLGRLCGFPGVREAHPGEFSARAFLNGRLTLDQAEGIAATIAAQTDRQLSAADALLSGTTGARQRERAEELAMLLALVEAGIDFTDQEDVVPIAPAELHRLLAALLDSIHGDLGAAAGREQRTALPRVVLAGAPNAGKSTLFNALLGRRRAVVSDVAGTTRDALVEPLELAPAAGLAPAVELVDLPGLDITAPMNEVDRQAQARAREELGRADVVVLCDPSGRFRTPADGAIPPDRPVIRVRTKADLPAAQAPAEEAITVCALDGWNLGVLKRAIADAVWGDQTASGDAYLLPRHRRALVAAAQHIQAAMELVAPNARTLDHPETVATELRTALDALAELTGAIPPDDIIGRVFATFCVGK